MSNKFDVIYSKLDEFINRYYLIKIIRGSILLFAVSSFVFISASLLVYFLEANTTLRTTLFFLLLVSTLVQLYLWVLSPLLKRFGVKGRISYTEAALKIEKLNKKTGEKLINGIELNAFLKNNALIIAGLDQIIKDLNVFKPKTFVSSQRAKQVLWSVIPFVLVFVLTAGAGKMSEMLEGTERLVSFRTNYLPKGFVAFKLISEKKVNEGTDYTIRYKLVSEVLPDKISLWVDGVEVSTKEIGVGLYESVVRAPYKNFSVSCQAGKYIASEADIEVVKLARIKNYVFRIAPPKYTQLSSKTVEGVNFIEVPENSNLSWSGAILNTDMAFLTIDTVKSKIENKNGFNINYRVGENQLWTILDNEDRELSEYNIRIIKDRFPKISIHGIVDSSKANHYFFSGVVSDDYGFKSLLLIEEQGGERKSTTVKLTKQKKQEFFIEYTLKENTKVYFEVRDNDSFNGFKKAVSTEVSLKIEDREQLKEKVNETKSSVKAKMKERINEARESESNKEEKTNKIKLEDDKKNLEELLKLSENFKRQLQFEKENKLYDEDILEKQEQVEKRFKEVDRDIRELLMEIERLQEELDSKTQNEEQFDIKKEDVIDELDRMMELLDRLQFEKDLEDLIDKAEGLKEKEKKLSEVSNEEAEDQERLQKEYEELRKSLDELKEKSDELDINELDKIDENNLDDIDKEMSEAKEKQKKGKEKAANESQKKASDKLDKLKKELEDAKSSMSSSQNSENMEDLRQLLENLLILSESEEELQNGISKIKTTDPSYTALMNEQGQYKKDYKIIKDSLTSLIKRVPEIENTVIKDLNKVDRYFVKSTNSLKDNNINKGVGEIRYIMTSLNNLALLLNQSLDNMQSQESKKSKGDKSCKKPGSGKPSMSELKKMQEKLSKDAEKMQKEMGGSKPKKGAKGKKGQGGKGGSQSKKMAEMMGRQEMIRKGLKEHSKGGGGNGDELDELLKKNEEDLANMNLDSEFLKRQKEIENKMLESEKALIQREEDEKRESESNYESYERQRKESLEEYLRKSLNGLERISWEKLLLSPFYERKILNEEEYRD